MNNLNLVAQMIINKVMEEYEPTPPTPSYNQEWVNENPGGYDSIGKIPLDTVGLETGIVSINNKTVFKGVNITEDQTLGLDTGISNITSSIKYKAASVSDSIGLNTDITEFTIEE